jgi:asparagine synthase (glutamine-hydrolysing)
MCGIAGIVRTDGRPVDPAVLARMAARLAHRGPDQEGMWLSGEKGAVPFSGRSEKGTVPFSPGGGATEMGTAPISCGLAVRRLAVIDPGGSRQPLSNESGTVWLAYNGEVYNFRDLREGLSSRGHTLRSAGDSEVLVHLYEDHGPKMLAPLVGMFAFAIWDAGQRRLLLARDRLGQKPLYWSRTPAGLAFASEPASLLECPDVPREVDRRALGAFLRFGYVPAPATGFAGIQKLPPAHYLIFDAATAAVQGPTRYWDIPRGPAEENTSAEEWRERLLATLSEAVKSQLVADVPLGVLLSGGLDSSAIAALAAAGATETLRTFTVRFAEAGWDESAYAREVAHRFGAEHTEVRVEPRCLEALPELVERHGEPFADSSAVAMYYLAREARREITVALSGDGGDESFGGYPRHGAMMMSERMGPALRRLLARIGRHMHPHPGRKSRWNAARRFFSALDLEPLPRYLAWRSLFLPAPGAAPHYHGGLVTAQPLLAPGAAPGAAPLLAPGAAPLLAPHGNGGPPLQRLLTPDFAADALADDPLAPWLAAIAGLDSRPWVDRAMAIDLADYLPNDCLAKVDIASMRHGLEVRSPFLDHRVVELARRMPAKLKWRSRVGRQPQGKAILRELFGEKGAVPFSDSGKGGCPLFSRLPRSVLARGKMGFGVPVSEWLAGEHAEWMRGILLDPASQRRGLFARQPLEDMIRAHTGRRADHGERLWALVCLELWFGTFGL